MLVWLYDVWAFGSEEGCGMVEKVEGEVVLEWRIGAQERAVWGLDGHHHHRRWLLLLRTGGLKMEPGMD